MRKLNAVVLISSCFLTLAGSPDSTQAAGVHKAKRPITGQYIVVLRRPVSGNLDVDVTAEADRISRKHKARVGRTWRRAVKGFVARMSAAEAEALAKDPNVALVEEDGVVSINYEQPGATWGLDRIDQPGPQLTGSYTYNATGANVRVYVIDTGILTTHAEFIGRTLTGYTAINDGYGTDDCNGHGTHVAGTIGGTVYGVAKGVTLIPVRVLDCSGLGSISGVISGINWVTTNAILPAVANMSLGGGISSALDTAVTNSVISGVTYAVAAGNSNANACNYSPARAATAITVGATTSSDARASYSNYGTCLDLFAPGSNITSAWNNGSIATISGTSMATPHVAGAAALYLETQPTAEPGQVTSWLLSNATAGVVTSLGSGSPSKLLYTGAGSSTPTEPSPPAPPPTPSNLLGNAGFEDGNVIWTATTGVVDNSASPAARTGLWKAWLNGYGRSRTDSLYQSVTIPAGIGSANLSFYLRITTSETTTSRANDTLRVQLRSPSGSTLTTLATYSNLNKTSGYVQKSFDLKAYQGQTVRLYFLGSENSSRATSFFIDDTSLTTQ